jgi:DNA-binding transcriptional LysR family regulator
MHLGGLDLNLLVALDALLTEKNVTRAAERIHVSQPGMSAALQKLRDHFADQLLERIGRNFALTTKGRVLAEPVKAILSQIADLNDQGTRFDASSARRVFRVSATTYGCEIVATPLISRLREVAPLISVQFEELSTKLFTDEFVVAISKNNALTATTITFDELCEMGYIETRFGGVIAGVAEQLWRQQPKQPHTCGWLPNFQLTMNTVGQTDMATIVPSLLVTMQGEQYNVRSLPVPFEMPTLEERLYWHRRNDKDSGHVWMRRTLEEVTTGLAIRERAVSP